MGRYWDAAKNEEVCYAANGRELLRHVRPTGDYKPGDMASVPSVGGMIGLFGQPAPERRPATAGPVSLQSRTDYD